ncbi:hypothetical protein [Streptomyces uncialis]|uniref:hypothetical protein n=1 Tax=Streptomyces uncialis TaxID=1048205 RepID=UPI0038660182|nr:hypothetical protein OG268_30905 [Streptomyces uncialis]
MQLSRKLATGALTLVSVATMSSLASPAGAAQPAPKAEKPVEITLTAVPDVGAQCGGDWKRAVGIPLRWKKITSNCSTWGSPSYKAAYQWKAERGAPCIKVKGFQNGREKWFNAGCGRSGQIRNVPWGNVAAKKAIQVKGASLFRWR